MEILKVKTIQIKFKIISLCNQKLNVISSKMYSNLCKITFYRSKTILKYFEQKSI